MSEFLFPAWQGAYQQALAEIDLTKLGEKIQVAEEAILERLQYLPRGPEFDEERQAIDDAFSALNVLKREMKRFPEK